MKVTRVPAYSPEAIAEHAMGTATANRRIPQGLCNPRPRTTVTSPALVGVTLQQDRQHH